MGYKSALEAAGCVVHAFENFGSYQGEWLAKVTKTVAGQEYTGYVHDWYGSCTMCDSYEAEFGYSYDDEDEDYERRLREFGQRYEVMPESWMQDFLWPDDDDDDDYVSFEREEMRVWFAKVREGEYE